MKQGKQQSKAKQGIAIKARLDKLLPGFCIANRSPPQLIRRNVWQTIEQRETSQLGKTKERRQHAL